MPEGNKLFLSLFEEEVDLLLRVGKIPANEVVTWSESVSLGSKTLRVCRTEISMEALRYLVGARPYFFSDQRFFFIFTDNRLFLDERMLFFDGRLLSEFSRLVAIGCVNSTFC